jgi:hypothetical protein
LVGVVSGVRLKTDLNPDGNTDVRTDAETVDDGVGDRTGVLLNGRKLTDGEDTRDGQPLAWAAPRGWERDEER